ncbi:hypothetical protein [Pseudopedobacter beijingensis]|uniref:Por secretion system C-terminal sorting domain-containing protein n=1 Tax=Pseudopedobacter beijingensis TaxID=1207056 RepID=A0ABW4IFL4_9SPHI
MKKLLLLSFGLCLLNYVANAQAFIENFESYSVGSLVGQGNWVANTKYSGVPIKVEDFGAAHGGKVVHIKPGGVAGDGPVIPFNNSSLNLATTGTGTIYVSFLVQFNALPTGANGNYFFYLADMSSDPNNTDGRGRLYAKPDPTASGKFAFGAIASSNVVGDITYTPYIYEIGKTYLIIEKYTKYTGSGGTSKIGTDNLSLWISETTISGGETSPTVISEKEADGTATVSKKEISGVGFRTMESSYDIVIDNIKVDLSWSNVLSPVVPLPVKLTSFTGQNQNNHIQLNWATASEQGNSHFEVLRSGDGKNFNVLTTVSGKGTTTQISNYSYIDANPLPGTNYYQLRQVDYDGKSENSGIIAIKNTLQIAKMSVSTSSDQDYIKLFIMSAVDEVAEVRINGVSGNRITSQKTILKKGGNIIQLPLKTLNGIYMVDLISTTQHLSTKFVK